MARVVSFPLLRLPSLVQDYVVKQLRIREQYLLITLSKKAKRIARTSIRRESYYLNISVADTHTTISLRNVQSNLCADCFYIFVKPVGSTYEFPYCEEDVFLLSYDMMSTTTDHLELFDSVFKITGIVFTFEYESNDPDPILSMLPVIKEWGAKVCRVNVSHLGPNNDLFDSVMKDCRKVKTLTLACGTTPDFEWSATVPFDFDRFEIWSPSWFTPGHLTRLFMNCKQFSAANYQMTSESLNGFLKAWIMNSKLEYASIELTRNSELIMLGQILHDIENTPIREAYVKHRLTTFQDGRAAKISQLSGVEAMVCVEYLTCFVLTTKFSAENRELWSDYH